MKECPECGRCLTDAHVVCPDDGAGLDSAFEGSPTLDDTYLLLRCVGGGGMAKVYRARHLGLQRAVAVKVLRPAERRREAFLERFRREAEILARLRHPRLVEVTDFGVDEARGIPYLVMELLTGTSLAERVQEGGPLPLEEALHVLRQVGEALDHVHRGGVVHGDLKPSNVFLTPEDGAVRLLDFGLARVLVDPERTPPHGNPAEEQGAPSASLETDGFWGSPGYVAPERSAGAPLDPGSDIYSLGALAVALLTGQPPPQASPSSIGGDLPTDIGSTLSAPLAPEPEKRPASAAEFVNRLHAAAERVRFRRWLRLEGPRRVALAAGLGIALTALALTVTPGPVRAIEDKVVDLRFRLSAPRLVDSPLLLVLFDDASLEADSAPLATRGDEVGTLLQRALAAGSTGVALDLLLPSQWGRAAGFSELLIRHADQVVLAAYSPSGASVVGPEVVDGITATALGPARAEGLFGYVNILEDPDGLVRRAREGLRDVTGAERSSFAGRIADSLGTPPTPSGGPFWIDFTLDGRSFESLSWRDLHGVLGEHPETLRDRFLLVGADYPASGDRHFRVPRSRGGPGVVAGTVLHALTAQTLLEGRRVGSADGLWPAVSLGLLTVSCAAVTLLARRQTTGPFVAFGSAAAWIVSSFVAFPLGGVLLPTAGPLLALLVVTVLGLVLRRWLGTLPRLV